MQLSLMLKALKKKRFIFRIPDANDLRAKRISTTPAGFHALRRALPVAISVQKELFGKDGLPGGTRQQTLLTLDWDASANEKARPQGDE